MIVEEVKVTRNYQVTIPASIREKLGIKIGDKVIFILEGEKVILIPKKVDIIEIIEKEKPKLEKKYDVGEIEEEINKVIEKVVEKLESSS